MLRYHWCTTLRYHWCTTLRYQMRGQADTEAVAKEPLERPAAQLLLEQP
jgi:hypothetical protein